MYDMSGRVIFELDEIQIGQEGKVIDMSNFSDGIYIVQVSGKNALLQEKVFK